MHGAQIWRFRWRIGGGLVHVKGYLIVEDERYAGCCLERRETISLTHSFKKLTKLAPVAINFWICLCMSLQYLYCYKTFEICNLIILKYLFIHLKHVIKICASNLNSTSFFTNIRFSLKELVKVLSFVLFEAKLIKKEINSYKLKLKLRE